MQPKDYKSTFHDIISNLMKLNWCPASESWDSTAKAAELSVSVSENNQLLSFANTFSNWSTSWLQSEPLITQLKDQQRGESPGLLAAFFSAMDNQEAQPKDGPTVLEFVNILQSKQDSDLPTMILVVSQDLED